MKFGTQISKNGEVTFNFWAPDEKLVKLCIEDTSELIKMLPQKDGWFSVTTNKASIGSKYMFLLENGLKVPDPASRKQDDDVHGPSVVVDSDSFDWGDDYNWKGRPWNEAVIYELHTGAFSPEGTFKGIEEKLDYLVELGVTAIELMPLADFPGKRNWGYDGVLQFAVDNAYGTPEDLKRLIKAAHSKGLMVLLDVVYNHFGPDGNYLYVYAKSRFFEHKHTTPWGDAINFEDRNVRNFFIQNALYWLEEFRFDGFRFDAVHAIKDDSKEHILFEISKKIRERITDREIHLVLENDDNISDYLKSDKDSNKIYDAQWNDDFHHCMHIHLTGEKNGYYEDYTEEATSKKDAYYLARCFAEGFAYQGEPSVYRDGERRGQPSKTLLTSSFVNFIQNHDQVGNRAFGERISALTSEDALKVASAAFLLAPSVPLIFMGEEWASKNPFLFFGDFSEELAVAVREGRRKEFAKFPEFSDPAKRELIPDPTSVETFIKSKLDWDNITKDFHQSFLEHYKNLLNIRKKVIIPLINDIEHSKTKYEIIEGKAVKVEWFVGPTVKLQMLINFSGDTVNYNYPAREHLIYEYNQQSSNKELSSNSVMWFLF